MILPTPTIAGFEIASVQRWYYVLLAVAGLTVIGALNLLRSFVGRRWVSVGEHDIAAEALGVSIARTRISAFTLTSAVIGFAGALSAYYVGTASFESYNFSLAISYLAMIIIGGLGSVLGSVLGAVFITMLPYVLDHLFLLFALRIPANILAGIHEITFGALIVAFLLFEPRGLAEIWRRTRTAAADWPFRYRTAGGRG